MTARLRVDGLTYRVDRWLERHARQPAPTVGEIQARRLILDLLAALHPATGPERLCACRCARSRHDPATGSCRGLTAGVPCPCTMWRPLDPQVCAGDEVRRLPCGCEATVHDGRIVRLVDPTVLAGH